MSDGFDRAGSWEASDWDRAVEIASNSKLRIAKLMTTKTISIIGRLNALVLLASLELVVGPHASAQQNQTTKQAPLSSSTYSASVVSQVEMNHLGAGTWCYGSEPAFIFRDDRKLKRADIKGYVSILLEVPEVFNSESCSEDGRTISLFTHPNFGEPTLRLTIVDVPSGKKSEYSIVPPKTSGAHFQPGEGR